MKGRLASGVAAALLAACSPSPPPAGAVEDGVSLGLFATDPLYDYGVLVDEVAELGAGSLLVVVPLSLPSSTHSTPVLAVPTPTVSRTLRQAHAAGLTTTVMPVIHLEQRTHSQDWRGRLAPTEPERFWTAYSAALGRIAATAESAGAHRLVVGSELSSLEDEDDHWHAIIAEVRQRFSGRLSYSANWDHHAEVPFWDALDDIGVTAYHPVDDAPEAAWRTALQAAQDTAEGRPLIITEYGYPALSSAAQTPWDETTGAAADPTLQAQLYRHALAALACHAHAGAFAWNWFGHRADPNSPFSPRGRPAAAVLRDHFATKPAKRCRPSELP